MFMSISGLAAMTTLMHRLGRSITYELILFGFTSKAERIGVDVLLIPPPATVGCVAAAIICFRGY